MRNEKINGKRLISFLLTLTMLLGVFSQTIVSAEYVLSDNLKEIKRPEPDLSLFENVATKGEYSSLSGRAKSELIIKYKDGAKSINLSEKTKSPDITSLRSKEKINSKLELVEINARDDIGAVIEELRRDPNIEYVQPNYEVSAFSAGDEHIGFQWGIQNNGQEINGVTGLAGEDINLIPFVSVLNPSLILNEVTVAVLDSGVDINHADLAGHISVNSGEKADGRDNDGNGYTDDIHGWNFAGANNDVSDFDGHGTHIAGIIAAESNNIGVMGIAQNARILPLKVIENGTGYTSDIIEAIKYAESRGASVANCSFGSTYFNYALYEAMEESSMVFVCAAGNTGTISNIYPASYNLPNVLSVASVNNEGRLADNASYGQNVDIAAPGVDIYSTAPGNLYTYESGSSYAAAAASGAAAALIGVRLMTASETAAVLKQGAAHKNTLERYIRFGRMLDVFGSYELICDGGEIVIAADDALSEYDSAVLEMVEADDYYGLTGAEKEFLLESFRVSESLLEECLLAGYSLGNSLKYAEIMGRFGFSLDEVTQLYAQYGVPEECDFELGVLDTLIGSFYVSVEDFDEIKQLVLIGYKPHNIIYAYNAAKALDIPLYTIIKKDGDVSGGGYTAITEQAFSDEEKKQIWKFSCDNWLCANELAGYMAEFGLTYAGLLELVYSRAENILIPLSGGENPNKYPDAPFSYRSNINERINLNTGGLVYESADAVLPGKNGMDLSIVSRYDSYSANIHDTYTKTSITISVDPQYPGIYITGVELSSHLKQSENSLYSGMGIGWSLGFGYIETDGGRKYLHMAGGGVYPVASSFSAASSNLEGYTLTDIQLLFDNGTYSNGQVSSYYVLRHKSGLREYFSFDGRLIGQKDRFGNTIKFEHTQSVSGKYNISKITDTHGRVVNISYTGTSLGQNVVVTMPDGGNITYVLEKLPGYFAATYMLVQKTDQLGNVTQFSYSLGLAAEKLYGQSVDTANKRYVNLIKVTYPTGAVTEYTYEKRNENIGVDGSTQAYKIVERHDRQSGVIYNAETYTYSGSHTAYPSYSGMAAAPGGYTYMTEVASPAAGKRISSVFNKQNLKTSVATYDLSGRKLLENIYEYNKFEQMMRSCERVYGENGTSYVQSVNTYEYDQKNNVTGHFGPLAGTDTSSAEYKVSYTYDSLYGHMTSMQYKQNGSRTVTEEYTLSSDKKSVEWKKVYETQGTAQREIREAAQYIYDVYGNVTEQRRFSGDLTALDTYTATKYEYLYRTDKTSALTVWTEDVRDADGVLCAPGENTSGAAGVVVNKYEYDEMGRLFATTDGRGYETLYSYDETGRNTGVTNPDETSVLYEYDDAANTVTETNEAGTEIKYIYDGFGNIKSVRDTVSGIDLSVFTYDALFRLKQESTVSASSESGAKTVYTYDTLGRTLTKTTSSAANTLLSRQSFAYGVAGEYLYTTQETQGDSNAAAVRTVTYTDKAGRIAKQGYYLGGTEYTDDYGYDYAGNRLSVLTAYTKEYWENYPATNVWEYDYAGRVVREYDVYGSYSSSEYNALGQKTSAKTPAANEAGSGEETVYTYDALGRLIKQTTPFEGSAVSVQKLYYDANGNTVKKKVSSNEPGKAEAYTSVGYEYDSGNRAVTVTSYAANGTASGYVQYYYDEAGNMLRMYTGLSSPLTINGLDDVSGTSEYSETAYSYDRFGNVMTLTDPLGNEESYTYDLLGNTTGKTDRNGEEFEYSYDGLGRLRRVTNSGTVIEEHTYTLAGGKRAESNGTVSVTYTYDELGRVITASDKESATGAVATKEYTYDIVQNILQIEAKSGNTPVVTTGYTYDEAGRMESVSEGGVTQCLYSYDANGNRSEMAYANGITAEYTYNSANMLIGLTNKKGAAVVSSYTYEYRLDGNQITKTDNAFRETAYSYDGLGRLTGETETANGNVLYSLEYTYDAGGNRASMTAEDGSETGYGYDKNNRLIWSVTESDGEETRTDYTYDKNGNTLSKLRSVTESGAGGTGSPTVSETSAYAEVYGYDLYNRMVYSNTEGVIASYAYRPDGLRHSKTSDGETTVHIWSGSNIIGELKDGGVDAAYIRGIGLAASKGDSGYAYYLYNGHGDTVQLSGGDGNVTFVYRYDAFGNEREADGEDTNPFRYCGEYYDGETGSYYLRARYYDPVTGRFLTEDGYGFMQYDDPLSLNLYTYCHNNPVMYTDPSGNAIENVVGLVIGAGLGAALGALVADYYGLTGAKRWAAIVGFTVGSGILAFFAAPVIEMFALYLVGKMGLLGAAGFIEKDGMYHAHTEALQKYGGYNDFYDYIFDRFTDMEAQPFEFSSNGQDYRFWVWKGDYLNFGAGAELGIYERYSSTDHWVVNTNLAMTMTMILMDAKGNIFASYNPQDPQWWITTFDPSHQNVAASSLIASFTVTFTDVGLFNDFVDSKAFKDDKRWSISPDDKYTLILKF